MVKPVGLDKFMKACNKAKELYELKQNAADQKLPKAEYVFLNVGYSLMKIFFNDITHVEGLKDYIQVHLESTSKAAIVRMSMKNMEETLPANFKRIHKSFIVNLDKVTSIKKNALLIGEQELPVSDSYKGIIDELLNNK